MTIVERLCRSFLLVAVKGVCATLINIFLNYLFEKCWSCIDCSTSSVYNILHDFFQTLQPSKATPYNENDSVTDFYQQLYEPYFFNV